MKITYEDFQKHKTEIFELTEKILDDMVEYDPKLVAFTPIGDSFNWWLTDDEIYELKIKLDNFNKLNKPLYEEKLREILEE